MVHEVSVVNNIQSFEVLPRMLDRVYDNILTHAIGLHVPHSRTYVHECIYRIVISCCPVGRAGRRLQ